MSIFSPPTDSVYKFLAVGGLIATIMVCYFMVTRMDSNSKKQLLVNEQQVLLDKEYELFIDELKFNSKYKNILSDKFDDAINKIWGYNKDSLLSDSVAKSIIYNLPNSTQKNFKNLLLKKELLVAKANTLNSLFDYTEIDSKFLFILYIISIALGAFGFANWYDKIQKPIDETRTFEMKKNLFKGELWLTNCQSCCKTFINRDEFGTEDDGTISKMYCKECYFNGQFVEPDLTFEEAQKRLGEKLSELEKGIFFKKRKKKDLKNTVRWSRKFNW